ncbi:SdiA-regulated domain-containing protein [Sediminitomix flava]|uniref:Uncharacterized protein YjiK n=1 Tax=Sediminitomix flava TaxID=379075 RepID=A0A315Z8D0_SEDFL|nr:SdiA-regulated domain-containing protein [Sediminitomix flava]PWJ41836.1 uncharacterized protein YjiK [Sediminitomix flava]
MQVKKGIIHLLLFLVSILLINCNKLNKKDDQSVQEPKNMTSKIGYDLSKENALYHMPVDLMELSGMTYWKEETILCVNDEKGKIYGFNLEQDGLVFLHSFDKDGDYEGIAHKEENIYVIRSDGKLYSFDMQFNKVKKYDLPFTDENDIEGLCFHPDSNSLFIALKGDSNVKGEKKKKYHAIYEWSLKSKNLQEHKPVIKIKDKELKQFVDYKGNFMPSGIAMHPYTHDIYIISHRAKLLIVYDPKFNLKEVIRLDKKLLKQPESITFMPNADLLIGSEGDHKQPAVILRFKYLKDQL